MVLVLSVVGAGAVTTGVLAAEETDDNDSRSSATEMAANSTETGTVEANDTDWYAFDVEAGDRIHVDLTMTTDNKENLHFDIIGPNGEEAEAYPNDALGPAYTTNRLVSGPSALGGDIAEQSGTYYVQVRSAGDTIGEPTDYELTVETQTLDQYDPNEQPASAASAESGETISAVMSGSDDDVYALDLEKGETVNLTTNHSNSVLVNTQLLGPNASDVTLHGFLSEHVVAWDYSDSFTYTANTSGTYFIRVTAHEEGIGSFDKEAPYELTATVSGADDGDNDDSRETATEMAPNSTETGALESNDTDWYAFDVESGERIWTHLDLGENDTTLDENTSARLDIFGPSGEKVNDYPHDGM
ncbi:PPC domain-containing protein, partial [Halocatena pleomorpha]|uniref:PPC domain-containing protein n=1 Tax=Halocatena pleomorpha TaxID=1785090 RepID=UPI001C8B0767